MRAMVVCIAAELLHWTRWALAQERAKETQQALAEHAVPAKMTGRGC